MNSKTREVVCSAPGRAGIIGNPTDMYGGSVISCSVSMRARVTVTPAERLVLATNGEECIIRGRDDLRPRRDLFDIPRAILDYMRLPPLNCRIEYASEIPMSSGMSSSTALLVTTLQAILAWRGEYPSLYQLAERAQQENIWMSGEISAPGTLKCMKCGHELQFQETTQIPPCPECGKHRFKRISK